jgi:rhodanese-related sulfurtransferase
MYRKRREYRRHRRSYQDRPRGSFFTSALRRPSTQIAFLLIVALVIFLILQFGARNANSTNSLPSTVSVNEAYTMYQNGAFILDVRTLEEWNEFHAPNTTLIPLDQLVSRLGEVPHDRQIVVVCRSGNRSQQGRDILLNAGFEQVTSMTGGLSEWRASGYPLEP